MVNKNFWLGILAIVLVFGMTVIGCVTNPFFYSNNTNYNFTILGEVTYTDRMGYKFGYIHLLEAAKKKYPDCDYVIDVMVDKSTGGAYFMRGTAIKYKKD
jgi:hypothetical protein